jgi:hypothetical protein
MHHSEPIREVFHDADDDGWQFHTGGAFSMEDALLVSLKTIVLHDPTVAEVADLAPGWMACREGQGQPWTCCEQEG